MVVLRSNRQYVQGTVGYSTTALLEQFAIIYTCSVYDVTNAMSTVQSDIRVGTIYKLCSLLHCAVTNIQTQVHSDIKETAL